MKGHYYRPITFSTHFLNDWNAEHITGAAKPASSYMLHEPHTMKVKFSRVATHENK